jgi:hypothetical protein
MAQSGSSLAASLKARSASWWLKPYVSFRPWSKNCWARSDWVVTG